MAILEGKDPCFKQIGTSKLGSSCSSFGISHKYGIVCAVIDNQLHLIHTEELLAQNNTDLHKTRIPCHVVVCNEEIIVVGYGDNVIIYSYPVLIQEVPKPLASLKAKSRVKKLLFNPTDDTMLAVLSDDGNLLLTKINMTGTGFQNWALNDSKVTSLCFSPKGKQLCVGQESGEFTQLKLDLTVAKKIKGPGGIPVSLLWVSTSQYLTLMLTGRKDNIALVQIDLHKAPTPPTYVDFTDVFLSESIDENSQSYFNVSNDTIVCSSSTSSDVVVLVKNNHGWSVADDIEDRRRAALPLDNFAVGGLFYFNYQPNVSFNDSETYGPMPVYIIGSQDGIFTCFSFVNKGGIGENIKLKENLSPLTWNVTQTMPPERPPDSSTFVKSIELARPQPSAFNQQPHPIGMPPPFSFSTPVSVTSSKPSSQRDSTLFSLLSTPTTLAGKTFTLPQTPSMGSFLPPNLVSGDSNIKSKEVGQDQVGSFGFGLKADPAIAQEQRSIVKELQEIKSSIATANAEFSETLQKRFDDFEKRMQSHRNLCKAHNEKFKIDEAKLSDDMENRLLSQVPQLDDFVDKITGICKIQRSAVNVLKEKGQSQYSQLTYAQSVEERNRDPKYLQLLKAMPMNPATVNRFKELEKSVKRTSELIQESRRHFYFAKCPPLNSQAVSKFIYKTLENHNIVIKNLRAETDKLKKKLKVTTSCPSVDELTAGLKKATLNDPKLTIDSDDLDNLKNFVRRKNIIKVRTSVDADYNYSDGILTNREGISESVVKTNFIVPPMPTKITNNIATQTDLLEGEFTKVTLLDTHKKSENVVKPVESIRKPSNETLPAVDASTGMVPISPPSEAKHIAENNILTMGLTALNTNAIPETKDKFKLDPAFTKSFGLSQGQGFGSPLTGSFFGSSSIFDKPAAATSTTTTGSVFGSSTIFAATTTGSVFGASSTFGLPGAATATATTTTGSNLLDTNKESENVVKPVESGRKLSIETFTAVDVNPGIVPISPLSISKNIAEDNILSMGLTALNTSSISKTKDIVKLNPPLPTLPAQATATTTTGSIFGPASTFGQPDFLGSVTKATLFDTNKESGNVVKPVESILRPSNETFTALDSSTGIVPLSPPSVAQNFAEDNILTMGLGALNTSTTSETKDIVKPNPPQPTTLPAATTATSTTGSIFGSASTFGPLVAGTAGSSAFGSTFKFSDPAASASPSIFGGSNVLSQQPSNFSSTTTPGSVFGSSSIFGQPTATTTTESIFGQPAAATTTGTGSIFGSGSTFGQPGAGTAGSTAFGSTFKFSDPAASASPSIFGSNVLSQQSSFSTAPPASVFGSTSGGSLFGSSSTFGQPPASSTAATGGSIFGGSTFGQESSFGSRSPQEQKPTFGGPSVFGSSPFGSTPFSSTSSPPSGSIFGGGLTQAASFGQLAQQPISAFGSAAAQPAPSPFGQFSQQPPTAPFGAPPAQSTSFGQFGQQQPTTAFGSALAQPAPFGQFAQTPNPSFASPVQQKPLTGNSFSSWR